MPQLPVSLQPFTVAEFFPTPGLSDYFDSRQHAIALCYVVPIAGDCKPQDETLDRGMGQPEQRDPRHFHKPDEQRIWHDCASGDRLGRQVADRLMVDVETGRPWAPGKRVAACECRQRKR